MLRSKPVYVLGDFSVKPAEKGWKIEAPVSTYTMEAGKDQGLPFYSWGVTYSEEFQRLKRVMENGKLHWVNGMEQW